MNRRLLTVLHLLVWVLIIGQETNVFLQYDTDTYVIAVGFSKPVYFGIISAFYRLNSALIFYGIAFMICPLLFRKKRYIHGAGTFILLLGTTVLYRYLTEFYILKPYLQYDNYFGKEPDIGWYIKNCLLYNFTASGYALYGIIYFFGANWYRRAKELKELEHQKAEAELSFLRYQVNPHFLFNSINDIYALSVKNKDEASQALLRLSSMLRYLVTDDGINMIPLNKEIGYLWDYIELQRISYQDKLRVNFKIVGEIDGWEIPRLLLVPFVENIFKHGEIMSFLNPAKIDLNIHKNNLSFICQNKVKTMFKDTVSGIGLNNVKRRLDLIYPGHYELLVLNHNEEFIVQLNIQNSL